MSKTTDKMIIPYIMAGIGIIGSFIGITTFINNPAAKVDAKVEILNNKVAEDRAINADRLGRIDTNVDNIYKALDKIEKKLK